MVVFKFGCWQAKTLSIAYRLANMLDAIQFAFLLERTVELAPMRAEVEHEAF